MSDANDQNALHTIYDPASHSSLGYQSSASTQLGGSYSRPGRRPGAYHLWGWVAALVLLLLLVAGAIILGDRPNYFPPVLMQQFPTQALFLIGMGTVIGLVLMLGIFRRASLRKPLAWSIGLLLFALIAVGWLWGSFINPYVGMTPTSFIRNTVSISTGDTLHMQNPANGVAQTLCIGVNQKCQPEDGAPGLLNRGIELQPGQSITITFNTNGNYHITSETTPGMNLSVDVSTSDADVSY